MRTGTVSYKLEDLKKGVIIHIGFVGENDFTRVIFDAEEIYKKYPSASVSMKVLPPKGGIYPATVIKEGNNVIWQVKAADLAYKGNGEIQLKFTAGEMVEKSYIARTDIKRSLEGNGPAPDPVQDWIDRAEEVVGEAQDAAEAAEAAAQHAPMIGLDGYWYRWDAETEEYVNTGTKAQGEKGDPGDPGSPGDPTQLIDDTAGEGQTGKTWSADKLDETTGQLLTAIQGKTPKQISFIDNVWINNSGIAEQDNTYKATDFVELDGIYALSYTGKTGSSFSVFWYDGEKNFISASMKLNTRMAWFEDVINYRPADAEFVRLQTQKITTPYIPEVTAYFDEKSIDELKENIIGDGVTDDTIAVQKIVNMGNSVVFPKRDTILITAPINIRLGKARIIDGNGCTLIADDDFTVLSVEGTLNTASDATLMDAYVVKHEACALIENFRITAIDTTEGCGISLTKGFKTKLCNNYVHHMKNGIRLYGRNRDIIISENNIFAHIQNGILIDEGSNLHQCNIVNNMIQYAHDNIHIYHPVQIANVQIVGNDIEIDQFPPSTYSTATCINFENDNTTEQLSEVEITGNTIQGHQVGQNICEFIGVEGHNIACMAFTGNHVSNAHGHGIKMAYVKSITISGNNYAVLDGYVYGMDGVCENININGEAAANNVGGKIKAESTATLNEIKCKNVLFAANDKNSILTNNVTNVDIYDEKIIEIDSSTPSIVADPNALYMCGEVRTLSFTPCSSGDCSIVFTSGSTPTVLTVPNTVRWTDEFDPTDIESSATYKIRVLNGELGTVNKWDAPQPQQYGGIPVLMDNCYYSGADAAIDSVNEDEGFFIAGPFDTGSIYGKQLTFTRFGSPKNAAVRLFNVYPPSAASADYATIFRTDMQQDGIPYEFTPTINGRYVITSIRKQNAADFYIKDSNGNYLIKGNNVT